jgi:hypothetical protein
VDRAASVRLASGNHTVSAQSLRAMSAFIEGAAGLNRRLRAVIRTPCDFRDSCEEYADEARQMQIWKRTNNARITKSLGVSF